MAVLAEFYLNQSEPNRGCFLAMRQVVLSSSSEVVETLKYGAPCFILKGKPFCYLWKEKKSDHPYFLMVDGKLLNHPELEAGDRKKMKILRVDPNQDLDIVTIKEVLMEAIEIRTKNHS